MRGALREALEIGESLSLRDLSLLVRISEKDLPGHLEHLEKTLRREGKRLVIEAPECLACGFVFRGRSRFSKPGRCPECRKTRVAAARVRLQ